MKFFIDVLSFPLRAWSALWLQGNLAVSTPGGCMQMLLLQGTFVDDVTEVLDEIWPVSAPLFFRAQIDGFIVICLLYGVGRLEYIAK